MRSNGFKMKTYKLIYKSYEIPSDLIYDGKLTIFGE